MACAIMEGAHCVNCNFQVTFKRHSTKPADKPYAFDVLSYMLFLGPIGP